MRSGSGSVPGSLPRRAEQPLPMTGSPSTGSFTSSDQQPEQKRRGSLTLHAPAAAYASFSAGGGGAPSGTEADAGGVRGSAAVMRSEAGGPLRSVAPRARGAQNSFMFEGQADRVTTTVSSLVMLQSRPPLSQPSEGSSLQDRDAEDWHSAHDVKGSTAGGAMWYSARGTPLPTMEGGVPLVEPGSGNISQARTPNPRDVRGFAAASVVSSHDVEHTALKPEEWLGVGGSSAGGSSTAHQSVSGSAGIPYHTMAGAAMVGGSMTAPGHPEHLSGMPHHTAGGASVMHSAGGGSTVYQTAGGASTLYHSTGGATASHLTAGGASQMGGGRAPSSMGGNVTPYESAAGAVTPYPSTGGYVASAAQQQVASTGGAHQSGAGAALQAGMDATPYQSAAGAVTPFPTMGGVATPLPMQQQQQQQWGHGAAGAPASRHDSFAGTEQASAPSYHGAVGLYESAGGSTMGGEPRAEGSLVLHGSAQAEHGPALRSHVSNTTGGTSGPVAGADRPRFSTQVAEQQGGGDQGFGLQQELYTLERQQGMAWGPGEGDGGLQGRQGDSKSASGYPGLAGAGQRPRFATQAQGELQPLPSRRATNVVQEGQEGTGAQLHVRGATQSAAGYGMGGVERPRFATQVGVHGSRQPALQQVHEEGEERYSERYSEHQSEEQYEQTVYVISGAPQDRGSRLPAQSAVHMGAGVEGARPRFATQAQGDLEPLQQQAYLQMQQDADVGSGAAELGRARGVTHTEGGPGLGATPGTAGRFASQVQGDAPSPHQLREAYQQGYALGQEQQGWHSAAAQGPGELSRAPAASAAQAGEMHTPVPVPVAQRSPSIDRAASVLQRHRAQMMAVSGATAAGQTPGAAFYSPATGKDGSAPGTLRQCIHLNPLLKGL